jgi:photosystem II stability/assembly factor-like uncharacterized protein
VCGGRLIVVGDHGLILASDDAGLTWQRIECPVSEVLSAVGFASDNQHGWAAGREGTLLATGDGGETWTVQWREPERGSFNDLAVLDADHVVAVGQNGLLVRTADGGKTWTKSILTHGSSHLHRVAVDGDRNAYLAAERGLLLRSNDLGVTWQALASPVSTTFYGILPLGPNNLLAYGGDMSGRLFRSTDSGTTWTAVRIASHPRFSTVLKRRDGTLFLAGYGSYFTSRDGGWSFLPVAVARRDLSIVEVVETPAANLLALGPDGATPLDILSAEPKAKLRRPHRP